MSLRRLSATCLSALLALACATRPAPAHAPNVSEDAVQIAAVYARFSAAANARSFAPMLELFAPDATWEASAGGLGFRHEGRPAISQWLHESPGHVQVLFYLAAPPRVDFVTPELAHAETSINELLRFEPSGEVKQLFGVYRDELRKHNGRWVFAARRFELRREQTWPS